MRTDIADISHPGLIMGVEGKLMLQLISKYQGRSALFVSEEAQPPIEQSCEAFISFAIEFLPQLISASFRSG
jgi:hypothetical protein